MIDHREIWKVALSRNDVWVSSYGRVCKVLEDASRTEPTYGRVGDVRPKSRYRSLIVNYKDVPTVRVHRLVCEAFHGPKPFPEAIVIHKDENSFNNHYMNLKWGTCKENANMPKLKALRSGDITYAEYKSYYLDS